MDQKTISVADAAQILGLSKLTVRRQVKAGRLPAIRLGRKILLLREPLMAMLLHPSDNKVA